MDYSLPGSSAHGIFQARTLEWVAVSFSRGLPDPGIKPASPALMGRWILYGMYIMEQTLHKVLQFKNE